jgi:hypothetical protein
MNIRLSDHAMSMYNYAHIVVHNGNNQDLDIQRQELSQLLTTIEQMKLFAHFL